MYPQFKVPFTCNVAAPSGSGKSSFIVKFLRYLPELLDKPISQVVWCYGESSGVPQEVLDNPAIKRHRGVPTDESGLLVSGSLIILDDLMREASNSFVSDLYTRKSRHNQISVILLSQNLFHQSKHSRDISLSTRYFVLLRNVRDRAQFSHLARQIYPENPASLCAALRDAWSAPFAYLLIDLDPSTDEGMRFRTNIFPDDKYMTVYVNEREIDRLNESGRTAPLQASDLSPAPLGWRHDAGSRIGPHAETPRRL